MAFKVKMMTFNYKNLLNKIKCLKKISLKNKILNIKNYKILMIKNYDLYYLSY